MELPIVRGTSHFLPLFPGGRRVNWPCGYVHETIIDRNYTLMPKGPWRTYSRINAIKDKCNTMEFTLFGRPPLLVTRIFSIKGNLAPHGDGAAHKICVLLVLLA